jgi:hypothetical protein
MQAHKWHENLAWMALKLYFPFEIETGNDCNGADCLKSKFIKSREDSHLLRVPFG